MTRHKTTGLAAAALVTMSAALAVPRPARASLDMQKKAKEAGFPAQNCQYCHVEKLPKKDAVTHNDRGLWLVAEKEKRKAKVVDVSWLKDYTEPKK